VLCYCPIEQIKNSIMPFVRKRQIHSCHYCHFFLFFSISWLVVADHINPLSAICLFISAWTGSYIELCRKCCAVHTHTHITIVLTKREKKAVNTQETESFWSGKWSLSTSAKRKKSIYIGSCSLFLFRWSDEYGHLFPSSITDGWIIIKKKRKAE
jgi:Zn-finger protein